MVPRECPEGGFTLMEILIAVTLLGVVMLGLGSATFLAYRTVDTASNSLLGSTDAQFVPIYLPADINSADVATTSGIVCTGTTDPKLELTSVAFTSGTTTLPKVVVVYWVKTITLGSTPTTYQYHLVRSVCSTGSKQSEIVVARNLLNATSAAQGGLFTGGCKMVITEKKASRDTANYTFSVSAQFRSLSLT